MHWSENTALHPRAQCPFEALFDRKLVWIPFGVQSRGKSHDASYVLSTVWSLNWMMP
jgi:hypothetical protein